MAVYAKETRKTVTSLYCCTGVGASLIVRYGSNQYVSTPIDAWWTKKPTGSTFEQAINEAGRRAVARNLIAPPKEHANDWYDAFRDGKLFDLTIHVRAESVGDGVGLFDELVIDARNFVRAQRRGARAINVMGGEGSVVVDFAPWAKPDGILSAPFSPLTFLERLVIDARERAARLDAWADQAAFSLPRQTAERDTAIATARTTAERYRMRAEAYETARVEMSREMGRDQ